jgi:hypothetical protein
VRLGARVGPRGFPKSWGKRPRARVLAKRGFTCWPAVSCARSYPLHRVPDYASQVTPILGPSLGTCGAGRSEAMSILVAFATAQAAQIRELIAELDGA